jgi:hypothetical protein
MIQYFLPILRKSVMVWIGMLVGIGGTLIGCGGGGDGVSGFSSVGDGDIPPAVDQAPMATISSPIDTFFNEGENIVFSGTGTDIEDGQLNDNELVWTSSIDGIIGSGSTLITSVLSPGDHDITLAATDSSGATVTSSPVMVQIEPSRFIKMGLQTTGVADASYAFDGFHDTAANISTAETEFIHFKAFIGGADTFLFRIKLGASIPGSSLAIDGLAADGTWQFLSGIGLDADKIVTVKVADAQVYKDADGYINLRARWINGQGPGTVPIYEFWRADPVYAGPKTIGVDNFEPAFDGDFLKPATITNTLTNSGDLLHFKAYVGLGQSNTFAFNVLLNNIGSVHFLVIEVEDIISGNWESVEYLSLDTENARTVSIQDAQNYLDADGYISMRAYWDTIIRPYDPSGTHVKIYEIWRIDPFEVGPKTPLNLVFSPESLVDGDLNSFAQIYYFWGESDGEKIRQDFFHVQTYVGDASIVTFFVKTAPSAPGSALIIDGEYEPGSWSVIERISLDSPATTTIELLNAREYVNADGYLSLRARWESGSPSYDAFIYEIWREED